MTDKSDVIAEINFLTETLSTQVRTVALGVLVLTWGLLIGDSSFTAAIATDIKPQLLGIGLCAVASMFLDFLQYICGYLVSKGMLEKMEGKGNKETQYDYKAISYRLRLYLFNAKCWLLSATVVWLIAVLLYSLIHTHSVQCVSSIDAKGCVK